MIMDKNLSKDHTSDKDVNQHLYLPNPTVICFVVLMLFSCVINVLSIFQICFGSSICQFFSVNS